MLGRSAAFLFLWTALLSLGTFCFMQPVREKTFPAWGYNMYLRNATHVLHIHHAFHMLALAAVIAIIVFVSRGHFTSPVIVLLGTLIGGSLSDLFYDDIREWKWSVSPSAYESDGQVKAPLPSLTTPSPGPYTDNPPEQQQEQQPQNSPQPGS
jgi:hypothetical protein